MFFPVFRDEATIDCVAQKALRVLAEIADAFEIVIVDDGSPDRSGDLADRWAAQHENIRVVHHDRNLGYGQALKSGFRTANRYEWVCFTDGDDQYDLYELRQLVSLLPHHDLVITFRRAKTYGVLRVIISGTYNALIRWLFGVRFRDLSSGLKLARREVLDNLAITSDSPFICGEIVVRAALKGYRIAEAGISMYPRKQGRTSIVNLRNILASLQDMWRVHREEFSNRPR